MKIEPRRKQIYPELYQDKDESSVYLLHTNGLVEILFAVLIKSPNPSWRESFVTMNREIFEYAIFIGEIQGEDMREYIYE